MNKRTLKIVNPILTLALGMALTPACASPTRERAQQTTVPPSETGIDLRWAFINKDINWESPPKYIEQTFQHSLNSTIVVFYPSGKFASVGCILYRDNKTKRMSISAGDDFSILKGVWKRNEDGSITATSRLTHGMIGNYPQQVQRWLVREQSSERLAGSLELNGQAFVPLPDVGNFDQLAPMIADDNQPSVK